LSKETALFHAYKFNRVFLINGLARSGNHLLVSWIISQTKKDNIYYVNNFKPRQSKIVSGRGVDAFVRSDKLLNAIKYTITKSKAQRKFTEKLDCSMLVKNCDYIEWLKDGSVKRDSILILTLENKTLLYISEIKKLMGDGRNIVIIFALRDILNLFASRIKSEEFLDSTTINAGNYVTDELTIDYWWDNFAAVQLGHVIEFNYNRFLRSKLYRVCLANRLGFLDPLVSLPHNKFGLTGGSSFNKEAGIELEDYQFRYKNVEHELLSFLHLCDKLKYVCAEYFDVIDQNENRFKKDYQLIRDRFPKKFFSSWRD